MQLLDQDFETIYGFKVYSCALRRAIIKFCGWTDVIYPEYYVDNAASKSRTDLTATAKSYIQGLQAQGNTNR